MWYWEDQEKKQGEPLGQLLSKISEGPYEPLDQLLSKISEGPHFKIKDPHVPWKCWLIIIPGVWNIIRNADFAMKKS